MAKQEKITYAEVSGVALDMIKQGITPSVRKIMRVTGGKTVTVSAFLKDFYHKRDEEVSKMAGELGNSKIAELLANEIQVIIARKTAVLEKIVNRQNTQIVEVVELLEEKDSNSQTQHKLVEAQHKQAVDEISEKLRKASIKFFESEAERDKAHAEVILIQAETKSLIDSAEQKYQTTAKASKEEASSLVQAANYQLEKAQSEAMALR